ncbi:MAG TPA: cytochrome c [Chthoniobacterales bacterium]|jgi:mono/diheme cytochrome c family protein|nr:cytochrome c [Chthoniobacterales bacterium]
MNIRGALSAPLIAVATASAVLASTLAFAASMERRAMPVSSQQTSRTQTLDGRLVASGRKLFLMNCAHCHADDATGDEGPDLHGLRKTDARLRLLISNGIKGEMPRFAAKLAPSELDALVAYLDSLR